MSHALPRLVAEPGCDQFVVAPHRAIEKNQRRAGKPGFQVIRDTRAGRDEVQIFAAGLVFNPQPERIARAVAACRMRLSFEVPCRLAGNFERQDFDAGGRAVGQSRFKRLIHLDWLALHILFAQNVEDAVGLQDRQHAPVRINRKRRTLAHRQQPGHRVDLAVSQDHARDRAVAQPIFLGMKLRRRGQLLAQIGRGIDEVPVLAVAAYRDRGLGASEFGSFASRFPANRTSAIPLRNPAPRGGAQDDDAKHDPPLPETRTLNTHSKRERQNVSRWTPDKTHSHNRERVTPGSPPRSKRERTASAYLRAAHAYMLISMPTGTSMIFGAFQAILALLLEPDGLRPRQQSSADREVRQ